MTKLEMLLITQREVIATFDIFYSWEMHISTIMSYIEFTPCRSLIAWHVDITYKWMRRSRNRDNVSHVIFLTVAIKHGG
jgi:hypothetical protein